MADDLSRVTDLAEESERTRGSAVGDTALIDAHHGTRPNRTRSQMLSLRVPADAARQIEDLASTLVVPVSSLLRGWILDGLAEHSTSLPRSLDRIEAELGRLRGLLK